MPSGVAETGFDGPSATLASRSLLSTSSPSPVQRSLFPFGSTWRLAPRPQVRVFPAMPRTTPAGPPLADLATPDPRTAKAVKRRTRRIAEAACSRPNDTGVRFPPGEGSLRRAPVNGSLRLPSA